MKANPSNRDLQEQAAEMHQCLEETRGQIDVMIQTIDTDRADSRRRDEDLDAKLHEIQQSVFKLLAFLGAPRPDAYQTPVYARPKAKKTLAGWDRRAAIATVFVAVVAGVSAYKVIAPAVWAGLVAANHALMTSR